MEKKMTYVDAINFAVENIDNIDVIEKLQALKESLEKRASYKSSKPSKTQRENENVKEAIVACLADNGMMRAMDVANELGITIQKASALLNQLVKAEVLEKVAEKKVNFFKVAEGV